CVRDGYYDFDYW
nr:immunoglobulin heavy chain junction region [Mus musculus]